MVFANLQRVKNATGVHSAIIGHTGKDVTRGMRGSNAERKPGRASPTPQSPRPGCEPGVGGHAGSGLERHFWPRNFFLDFRGRRLQVEERAPAAWQ
jgi:hypothetical protein